MGEGLWSKNASSKASKSAVIGRFRESATTQVTFKIPLVVGLHCSEIYLQLAIKAVADELHWNPLSVAFIYPNSNAVWTMIIKILGYMENVQKNYTSQ